MLGNALAEGKEAPTPLDPGIAGSGVYAAGRRVSDVTVEEASAWLDRPGHTVWIGLFEPSEELLRRMQAQFGLDDLAIEDAGQAHQRPKLQQYGDTLFIVARTAQIVAGRIAFGETHLFVGRGYIVSVRHGASASFAAVREGCEASPATLALGEDYILYAILDFIVENYRTVLETLRLQVEAIEDGVLKAVPRTGEIERLYALRRELLRLRDAIAPLVEVCRRLAHAEGMTIPDAMQPLFRDVSEHVRGVQEEIASLREVLAFAFEASLMMGQVQQTAITRRLAAWAAILAVPTAVAGIYGMNFEHMPELTWKYGYFAVLGFIAAVCAGLFFRFRLSGWL